MLICLLEKIYIYIYIYYRFSRDAYFQIIYVIVIPCNHTLLHTILCAVVVFLTLNTDNVVSIVSHK